MKHNSYYDFISYISDKIDNHAKKTAFIYLTNGEIENKRLTYEQLDVKSKAVAAELQKHAQKGDKILLLYLPGTEFICAFLGCLYAGMVAVPSFPFRNNRHTQRLLSIIKDCHPALILGTESNLSLMRSEGDFTRFHFINTETLLDEYSLNYQTPRIVTEDLALLQYTSGSTGNPKGVMVSYRNIIANKESANKIFAFSDQHTNVSWLPATHDMGLFGSIVYILLCGGTSVIMSPSSFLESPIHWLRAIQKYQAYLSGGPNFGYQLCVDKITLEEISSLDLSCWERAYVGSEPIRAQTLESFSKKFVPSLFRKKAFTPCYGMAEATLFVTGKLPTEEPVTMVVDKQAIKNGLFILDKDSEYRLVSSGTHSSPFDVKVVNPETCTLAKIYEIGEIWVSGNSVAQGYWLQPEKNSQVFSARLKGSDKSYLRTGDLGYIHDNQLYVTGRLKDLIILQGRNFYPQDLEHIIETVHPTLRKDCVAVFSVDINHQEQIIVVAEVKRSYLKIDFNPVFQAIRKALIDCEGLIPFSIYLIKPATTLKTTSGKIQRQATKLAFLEQSLDVIAHDDLLLPMSEKIPDLDELKQDISIALSKILPIGQIDPHKKFSYLGGSSLHAILFQQQLQTYVGKKLELSPTIAFDYPTVHELATYLHKELTVIDKEEDYVHLNKPSLEEPIAVVGFACRFPGNNEGQTTDFWELLIEGKEAVGLIPKDRWDWNTYYDSDPGAENKTAVKHGCFIEGIEQFDADFFCISSREAETMDPQQRLLLETTWHALEHSGIDPNNIKKDKSSVFIGASTHEYCDMLSSINLHGPYLATGNASSVLAGRLSYILGFQGPSMVIDTACSSSLVAVHEACMSLRMNESDLAISGGVNALLSPDMFINLFKAKMLATDGHCKVFSEDADGYVRGEGCGVVVLKRLSDAQKDGNNILALIKSTVINQDGASSGLTVPNGAAQEKLLKRALVQAGLKPEEIDYIETHGTGTKLGDPMETFALGNVFKGSHSKENPLYIGSVKSNIGHLEAASGIAGLIKVILALNEEVIPPQINISQLNRKVTLNHIPAQIPQEPIPWLYSNKPRRAGISSFGFSGTNAHMIIEEAAQALYEEKNAPTQEQHLFVISAKNKRSLNMLIDAYCHYLSHDNKHYLADICYSAALGRSHFTYRLAFIVTSRDDLLQKLRGEHPLVSEVPWSEEVIQSQDIHEIYHSYLAGKNINWAEYFKPNRSQLKHVEIPRYCFDRKHHWVEKIYMSNAPECIYTHNWVGTPLEVDWSLATLR